MLGPGYGHNIQPWLEFFQARSREYELSFLCSEFEFDRKRFSNIDIFERKSRWRQFFAYLRFVRKEKFDVLYIHGAYDWSGPLKRLLLARHKKSVINFWGEHVIRKAKETPSFRDRIGYKILFSMTDYFFCNWYGTYDLFTQYFPKLKHKTKITPWGLHKDWFIDNRPPLSEFVEDFLAGIADDEIFVFWPKSIVKPVRYNLLIKAIAMLKTGEMREKVEKLKVVIWLGNYVDKDLLQQYIGMLKELNVEGNIRFVEHPYVPFSDIYCMWQRSNFAINLVDNDQLSTAVLEPMLMGKDILLSDIAAYRYLNDKYDLRLNLVRNTPKDVAQGLARLIVAGSCQEDQALLDYRCQVVREEFQFDRNAEKIMAFLSEQVQAQRQK